MSKHLTLKNRKTIQERLGTDYGTLFSLILTDRGTEFSKINLFETNYETGELRTSLFCCGEELPQALLSALSHKYMLPEARCQSERGINAQKRNITKKRKTGKAGVSLTSRSPESYGKFQGKIPRI